MTRRQEYLTMRRNKIQNRKKKTRPRTNVHGVLFAPSPPVADHSLDVVDEQTRNLHMTPSYENVLLQVCFFLWKNWIRRKNT